MQRKPKRLLALLLAANMLIPMAMSAAAEDGTDPVNGADKKEVVEVNVGGEDGKPEEGEVKDETEEPEEGEVKDSEDEPELEENGGISVMSLLPVKEIRGQIDMTLRSDGYMSFEMKDIKISELLKHFKPYYGYEDVEFPENATTVWSREIDENGNYTDDTWKVHEYDETIDMTAGFKRNVSSFSLEMIVGSGDQLDPENVRLIVYMRLPYASDDYDITVYTQREGENGETVRGEGKVETYGGREDGILRSNNRVSSALVNDNDLYIGLRPICGDRYDVKYISGFYDTPEAALEAVENDATLDLTDAFCASDMSAVDAGFKYENWSKNRDGVKISAIFFDDDGSVAHVEKICLYFYSGWDYVSFDALYFQDKNGNRSRVYGTESRRGDTISYDVTTDRYTENDKLWCVFEYYDSESMNYGKSDKVEKAVVGRFDTLEAAKDAEDIKDKLFSGYGYRRDVGYEAVYGGNGVDFTIFANGRVYHYTVKITVTKPAPKPEESDLITKLLSEDKYFRTYTLVDSEGNELDTYAIPVKHDTLGLDGYQTIFVNDIDADLTNLRPKSLVANGAKIYHNGTAEKIEDGKLNVLSARDFTASSSDPEIYPENSAVYTVTAEDMAAHRNYALTVVKKTEGAKLFVNGPSKRTVFLNEYYGKTHDIFIANLGTEELTGINVKLDATNVKLDEYYTVGGEGNDTLAPFTETEHKDENGNVSQYGELMNVAKIRLIPDGDGEIKGTITISADGQEPRVIEISGVAGNPRIDTDGIKDAVKYVPYQSIITTNNMFEWNKVTFKLEAGSLPKGVNIYPDGEIYGVPTETGKYSFTVKAEFSNEKFGASRKTFILNVLDNTDENVEGQIDEGFEIITRVNDMDVPTDQIFEFEYDYNEHKGEFKGVWLDGEQLDESVDYDVDSGSTKITLRSQTFKRTNPGKHTIAAEYRNSENEVKKSAQNFNKSAEPEPERPSTGGGIGFIRYCTLSFDTNGGNDIDSVTMMEGGRARNLPTPVKDGYTFAGWYSDEELTELFIEGKKIYSDITIYAKWIKDITEPVSDIELPFTDVRKSDWCWNDVAWAYQNDLVKGMSAKQFAPDVSVTGGMVVAVLARMANIDISEYENDTIGSGSLWYAPYVNWAKEAGLLDGIDFDAASEISRENMGIILVRFMDYVGADYSTSGADVEFIDEDQISVDARPYMQTLTKLRVFRGRGNNVLDPLSLTTRAEFAALAHRIYAIIK